MFYIITRNMVNSITKYKEIKEIRLYSMGSFRSISPNDGNRIIHNLAISRLFYIIIFFIPYLLYAQNDLTGKNLNLSSATSTSGNIKIGQWNALNMYGVKNIYVGNAGNFTSPNADSNAVLGFGALRNIASGSRNVAIGAYAGGRLNHADGTVWIGNEAGNNSVFADLDGIGGIDNSNTDCPLIRFDFNNDTVYICGYLKANESNITGGGIDTLWYIDSGRIRNVNRKDVHIDSALYLTGLKANGRLGYLLSWEATTGNVYRIPISQVVDTMSIVETGPWYLDEDTTKTNYHVKVDLGFIVNYDSRYIGTKDPDNIIDDPSDRKVYSGIYIADDTSTSITNEYQDSDGHYASIIKSIVGSTIAGFSSSVNATGGGSRTELYALENSDQSVVTVTPDYILISTDSLKATLDSIPSFYSVYYNKVTGLFSYDSASSGGGVGSESDPIFLEDVRDSVNAILSEKGYLTALPTIIISSIADHQFVPSTPLVQLTAGENLDTLDICYINASDGKLYRIDATSSTKMMAYFMATSNITANATGLFMENGYVRDDSEFNWNVNGILYAKAGADGDMTQTAPSGSDDIIQIMGIAITADIIKFKPELTTIELY